jgi:hypothetical protein
LSIIGSQPSGVAADAGTPVPGRSGRLRRTIEQRTEWRSPVGSNRYPHGLLEVTTYPEWLPEPLEPVVARLARVDDCFGEMADISGRWSIDALELKQLLRKDGRYRTVVNAVKPIPPVISMLFSEAINHLRAVLDNTVWHLVTEQMGALDGRAARAVAMPIYDEPKKFSDWAKDIRNRVPELGRESSATHQRVKSLQPFADDARVSSLSPLLAILMGVEAEHVHPLLLLQAYSNLDKHRAIPLMVGRMIATTVGVPFPEQDRRFREMEVGTVVAPDGTWGTAVPIESQAAVMVERPEPWVAAVSPATETKLLRDWVRHQALPRLLTGSSDVVTPLPVTVELGDDGRSLRERIAIPGRPSADERVATINAQRFVESETAELRYPITVEEEFED